jgi:hypothetical protein
MSSEGLSDAVKGFIREHIESVEQIEILALVRGAPEREWTAGAVEGVLRGSEQSIGHRLAQFARAGILAKVAEGDEAYRYEPKTAALDSAAAATVEAYRVRPVLLIESIYKRPTDPAQSFADAFRFRPS